MDYRTLRRYVRSHPDSLQFLEEQTKDHLDQSHSVLIESAPAVAERLIQIALDSYDEVEEDLRKRDPDEEDRAYFPPEESKPPHY